MEQVYRQTGKRSKRLGGVIVPVEVEHVWNWFWDLRREGSLSMTEIDAYARLFRTPMTPWEVGTLRAMDSALSSVLVKHKRKDSSDG
jgi:3-hydroxyacyl-CoA dehydrogenase